MRRGCWSGRTAVALCVVLGGLVAGCGETASSGHHFYLGSTATGKPIIGFSCIVKGEYAIGTIPCPRVAVTNSPADEEFWQFEARLKGRALIGIPYGREPRDFNVIGSQETCEAVRRQATDPTEPCKGPFYFKRES